MSLPLLVSLPAPPYNQEQTAKYLRDLGVSLGDMYSSIAMEFADFAPGDVNFTTNDVILGRVTAGAGPGEEIACTAAGRALLDDANAAAQRTTLGLGTVATYDETEFMRVDGTHPVTAYIDMLEVTPPAAPAANTMRLYAEDFKGFSIYSFIDNTGMIRKLIRDSVFVGKNDTGATIPIGTAVYASGSSGNVPTIAPADASTVAKMPSIGITCEQILTTAFGRVMQVGLLENINTNAFTEGNVLFVSATTPGAWTATAPLYPNIRQEIGVVLVKSIGGGAIQCIARSMMNEGVIDHGGLLGLSDDDHPQYVKDSEFTTDGGILVATGAGTFAEETGATLRTSIGLGALAVLSTVGTTQIDAEAVTYAKMQHVSATDKVLGRATAGAGDVEEIACTAAGRALLDDATVADQQTTLDVDITVAKTKAAPAVIEAEIENTLSFPCVSSLAPAGALKQISLLIIREWLDDYYQEADAELAALAGLVSAADRLPYFTGLGSAALAVFTAAGRALLDDATAADQRVTLSAAALGANSDITSLAGLTTPLSVAQGGTGAATLGANCLLVGQGTGAVVAEAELQWDDTNKRLSIGGSTPLYGVDFRGPAAEDAVLGITASAGRHAEVRFYDTAGVLGGRFLSAFGNVAGTRYLAFLAYVDRDGYKLPIAFNTQNATGDFVNGLYVESGTNAGRVGIGTPTPKATLHAITSTIVGCATAAVADADIGASQVNVWMNEGTNKLTFKVKNSASAVASAVLPLSSPGYLPADIGFTATDKILGRSTAGAGAGEEIACTAAGRALLDDAAASDQRTTLGLGDAAIKTVGAASGVAGLDASTRLTNNIAWHSTPATEVANGVIDADTGVAGEVLAFGDLIYLKPADGKWWKADADAEATSGTCLVALAVSAANADAAVSVMHWGYATLTAWTWTVSSPLFVSGTAGAMTHTQPTGANVVVRVVGHAINADTILFRPDNGWVKRAS